MPQDPARPRATAIITIPAHPDLRTIMDTAGTPITIMVIPDTEAIIPIMST